MTNQRQVIAGRETDMVLNNAGGYTFKVSDWDRLDRFLVLGTEGNTYYQSGAALARENAQHVISLLRTDPEKVIERVVEISQAGRAPKNDYALFVLALAASDSAPATRQLALEVLPKVARTGTHLFNFVAYAEQFRGWGRAFRRAIGNWYTSRDVHSLAYQAVKYQSRDGWSNRDLIRLSHPTAKDDSFDAVFRWMVSGVDGLKAGNHVRGPRGSEVKTSRKDVSGDLPLIIQAFEEAKTASEQRVIELIMSSNLPREAIPTNLLTSAKVWEALLQKMPMTALVRNLATMTRVGLLTNGSNAEKQILDKLSDDDAIRNARLHPMNILMALKTYDAGRGVMGTNSWTPNRNIVDALDDAFYKSFKHVTPTGKKTLLALDVSGSMNFQNISGLVGITPRVASAAMALITANVEPDHTMIGFTSGGWQASGSNRYHGSSVREIEIDPKAKLLDVIKQVSELPFSSTDCALPMLWASAHGGEYENFSVYTDNETYYGAVHPSTALKQYRLDHNIPAKLAVFGMTATKFSIADPADSGMMDFAGFDSAAPELASQFFSK